MVPKETSLIEKRTRNQIFSKDISKLAKKERGDNCNHIIKWKHRIMPCNNDKIEVFLIFLAIN